ncbi:MAG: rod-binding protein [Treponema sp.]|jgi:flagellar protein FlgJ|nr:rod-binding protein [Treponema sp.]
MDINGLGAAYINDYRMTGNMINRNKYGVDDIGDFVEILEKAAVSPTVDTRSPLPVSQSSKSVTIDKTDKLYEQCLELEIFLVKTLVSSMRNTVQKSGLIDEGFAGKMYEDMLYDEYARDFAKNANFGLAELAYLELSGQRGARRQ